MSVEEQEIQEEKKGDALPLDKVYQKNQVVSFKLTKDSDVKMLNKLAHHFKNKKEKDTGVPRPCNMQDVIRKALKEAVYEYC